MAWTMRSRTMRLPFLLATPIAGAHGGGHGLVWRGGAPFVFGRYGPGPTPRAGCPVPRHATSAPMITLRSRPLPRPCCMNAGTGWRPVGIVANFDSLRIRPQAELWGECQRADDVTTVPITH